MSNYTHDIYSIKDPRLLINAVKEASGYKPVCVKIAAVSNRLTFFLTRTYVCVRL